MGAIIDTIMNKISTLTIDEIIALMAMVVAGSLAVSAVKGIAKTALSILAVLAALYFFDPALYAFVRDYFVQIWDTVAGWFKSSDVSSTLVKTATGTLK